MARLAIMGILLLGLMVPLVMVHGVVSERASRRDGAVAEVGASWGGPQTVGGPILAVPYQYTSFDNAGRSKAESARAYFLPSLLEIRGSVEPDVRRRSLFEVVVYRTRLQVTGRSAPPGFAGLRPNPDRIQWEDATLSFGVADPRGIARQVTLKTNGNDEAFVPGIADAGADLSAIRFPAGRSAPGHASGLNAAGTKVSVAAPAPARVGRRSDELRCYQSPSFNALNEPLFSAAIR